MTNTETFSSGTVVVAGTTTIIISPLTTLAWNMSGGDPTKFAANAKTVATAFGLGDVDIAAITPTDVNTAAAGSDAAGRYGVVLAGIAQMQKDTGNVALSAILDTLGKAVSSNASGTGQLSSAVASQLADGVKNLTDASKNSNAAVQTNSKSINVSVATAIFAPRLKPVFNTTPFANSLTLTASGSTTAVTAPVWGQSYTLTATGGYLSAASLAITGMSCSAATPSTDGKTLTATCTMPNNGSQVSAAVQVAGKNVAGTGASSSYFLSNGTASCQAGTPIVSSITPTTVAYAAQGQTITVSGCNLGTTTAATLDGVAANPNSGATANTLSYTYDITNTRNAGNSGTLVIGSIQQAIVYTVPAVTLTAASPSSLIQGANGSDNMTLTGTGLFTGMSVKLAGASCTGGTANATATSLTGVDCASVTVSNTDTSATLAAGTAGEAALSGGITLTVAPAPTLTPAANATVQIGGTLPSAAATSNSSGAVTYAVTAGSGITVDSSTGALSWAASPAAGSVTITATQAAVAGQYAAATATTTITVTEQTVPTLTFTDASKTVTLGDADFSNAATAACTTGGSSYAPSVTYSVTTGGALASVDSAGKVILNGAGTATIQAAISASGTCAGQTSSYTLTVNKVTPRVEFFEPLRSATLGDADITNTASVAAPTNNGSGTMPATTGLTLSYTSSNEAVATVSSAGVVTIRGAGTTNISANTAADSNYNATTGSNEGVTTAGGYTLTVGKATPTVTFSSPTTAASFGGSDISSNIASVAAPTNNGSGTMPATTGLTLSYTSSNEAVATVSSAGVVTIKGVGITYISANTAADSNYNATTGSNEGVTTAGGYTLTVGKATPTLVMASALSLSTADTAGKANPATLTGVTGATAPSGNVTYSSSDTSVATVDSAGMVKPATPAKAGNVTITASYAGDSNYNAATSVTTAVTVTVPPRFIKISSTGAELPNDATSWCAVKDTTTNLMWENKTQAGGAINYTNFDSFAPGNKQNQGTDATQAQVEAATNSVGFKNAQNAANLCGFSDWRLPTISAAAQAASSAVNGTGELDGLYAAYKASTANAAYFPNTEQNYHWSSSPDVSGTGDAWYVHFYYDVVVSYYRSSYFHVRLVR